MSAESASKTTKNDSVDFSIYTIARSTSGSGLRIRFWGFVEKYDISTTKVISFALLFFTPASLFYFWPQIIGLPLAGKVAVGVAFAALVLQGIAKTYQAIQRVVEVRGWYKKLSFPDLVTVQPILLQLAKEKSYYAIVQIITDTSSEKEKLPQKNFTDEIDTSLKRWDGILGLLETTEEINQNQFLTEVIRAEHKYTQDTLKRLSAPLQE